MDTETTPSLGDNTVTIGSHDDESSGPGGIVVSTLGRKPGGTGSIPDRVTFSPHE